MLKFFQHICFWSNFCFAVVYAYADAYPIDWQHGQKLYQSCAACHGVDGNISITSVPKLAGQNPSYLLKQLLDYQQNKRVNPIMSSIAQKLSAQDMNDLLAYMASFKSTHSAVDPKLLPRGQQLYRAGDAQSGIPACAACHGAVGSGNNEARFPTLSGQNSMYIIAQLQAFQTHQRVNDPRQMMQTVASKLSTQDKAALANFVSGLYL